MARAFCGVGWRHPAAAQPQPGEFGDNARAMGADKAASGVLR
jgi:hypothetical protein